MAQLRQNGSQIAAGAVASDCQSLRIDSQLRRVSCRPKRGRIGIVNRPGKSRFRGKPVVDREPRRIRP